jgi:hypothetical protein
MAYTFSEYPATTYYAENKTALQDVLQLLPDNTSKEITPRDVRDAVLSAWESNVFKYSSVSGTEYIGFTRDEIKDKKIFFGKKQISGSNIMSSSLLSSDTDIFLYNTKSDFASPQDFKMGFLAGTNSSLFGSAPYIQSTQVSGGNSYISLNLINPATYGTITIESGSLASVIINDLYWPSTTQVADSITSPSASTANDLFLVMSSPNNLELKTYTSLGGNLGSVGGTTTILGNTTLNGYGLEYTSPYPIVQSIGGVSVGTTFSSLPFSLLFDQILYPELGPFALMNITTPLSQNRTLERNHDSSTSVAISYTLTKRTFNITGTSLKAQRPDGTIISASGPALPGSGLTTLTTTYTYTVPAAFMSGITQSGVFTFSVVPNDGTYSFTASQTVEFVYPYIYSFSTTDYPLTSGNMNTLIGISHTKIINSYGSQSIPLSNPTTPQYLYFMYPSHYGLLSEILDGNGFSESLSGVGASWTFSQNVDVAEQSIPSKWNHPFNIYKKTQ